MKIVYIQPKSFFSWEALGVGYIGAYCKMHGYSDQEFFSASLDDEEMIVTNASNADIVAFSCTSPQINNALHLAERIKQNNSKVWTVFGGIHPTVLFEQISSLSQVDCVVLGEGEVSMLKILRGCRDLIVQSHPLNDLNLMPHPDRELIKLERHLAATYKNEGRRVTSIFSSRACPFNCVFCASKALWGRNPRLRNPDSIVDEFEILNHEWKVDHIIFADDEVGIDKAHFAKFCEKLISRGNKITWGCNMVVNTLDVDLLKLMRRAGCTDLFMGVESGSPSILTAMKKPYTVENIRYGFKLTKEIGFTRRAYVLLGMPDETLQDIDMTERLVEDISPDVVGFTILAPFPGTFFYDSIKHKDIDWTGIDEYKNDITATRTLTNNELHEIQKKLVCKFRDRIAYHHKLYE